MLVELNGFIELNPENPPKDHLILVTDSLADGSFLIHHFLSAFLKGGKSVCFLALAQSFGHYNAVSQKLGVNLVSARDSGHLTFVNGLDFSTQLLGGNQSNQPVALQCLKNMRATVQPLYRTILEALSGRCSNGEGACNRPSLLLIDDLSILISLGLGVQQVVQFIHYCQCSQSDMTIVCLVHHDEGSEDDCNASLITQLSHRSHCLLKVQGLGSGFSKDIHGQLKICKRDPTGIRPARNPSDRILQYKILDKSVSFFAIGTSSAVL